MIKEFQGKYRWLSNFWTVQIEYRNNIYTTVEHAYMSEKNGAKEWKYFCITEKSPKIVKKASLEIDLRADWEEIKENTMLTLTRIKYKEKKLQEKLLETKDQYIQGGNDWGDIFWGVDLKTGIGENKLGKIIMQVRDEVKESHILFNYLNEDKKIILFDGECNLCDWSVHILLKNDPNDIFRFASLQSDIGKEIQDQYSIDSSKMDSVILIDDYVHYKSKTSAIFSITRSMGGLWRLFIIFWIVPKPIRDTVYTYITKRRYQWFGKKNTCMVMSDDIRHKFLDELES